jgi:hypothetical protein
LRGHYCAERSFDRRFVSGVARAREARRRQERERDDEQYHTRRDCEPP